jgi:hypothetical protein
MNFNEMLENLEDNLRGTYQNWLFGAGISYKSNIPLMYQLTKRVSTLIRCEYEHINSVYMDIVSDLPANYHIEHVLSHLIDYITIAKRSASKMITLNDNQHSESSLEELYHCIIENISEIIRYGYSVNDDNTDEKIGNINEPIVDISYHLKFIEALFGTKANLVNRSTINIFTTNYDTLLEDSLGLIRKNPVDGFEGGAIAYWTGNAAFSKTDINDVLVCKLHGSIDWTMNKNGNLYRTRYGTKYTFSKRDVLIYPRATKYVETQKDPFASIFAVFRSKLNVQRDNVLITCGYSFGDDHINGEIDLAMSSSNNKTVLLAFSKTDQHGNINEILKK